MYMLRFVKNVLKLFIVVRIGLFKVEKQYVIIFVSQYKFALHKISWSIEKKITN